MFVAFHSYEHILIYQRTHHHHHPPFPSVQFAGLKELIIGSPIRIWLSTLFSASHYPTPGDSSKNLSGPSTKHDLLIRRHWPFFFYLINYVNCITSRTSHFELVAGKPEVKCALGSWLIITVCFCSRIPGSVLCCLSSFVSNYFSCCTVHFMPPISRE